MQARGRGRLPVREYGILRRAGAMTAKEVLLTMRAFTRASQLLRFVSLLPNGTALQRARRNQLRIIGLGFLQDYMRMSAPRM